MKQKINALHRPENYPGKPQKIIPLETHMSWVFLTEHHAYQFKKPVRYDYLDFSTLKARYRNCLTEVRLNRRLAPDVYFGIVPLTVEPEEGIKVEGNGEVIDWLVKMRRLPTKKMMDFKIQHQRLHKTEVIQLASLLSRFYRKLPPSPLSDIQYIEQLKRSIQTNRMELIKPVFQLPVSRIERITSGLLQFINHHRSSLLQRVHHGYVVEGHGDLRPEHICMEKPVPVIFDCLEFNRNFRTLDTADDLAFLSLECKRLGYFAAEKILFSIYRDITGDVVSPQLIRFYQNARSLLRAKLAIWHIHRSPCKPDSSHWHDLAMHYFSLAEGTRSETHF
jgi:aminoglycoside phosphotransferase family enzyme